MKYTGVLLSFSFTVIDFSSIFFSLNLFKEKLNRNPKIATVTKILRILHLFFILEFRVSCFEFRVFKYYLFPNQFIIGSYKVSIFPAPTVNKTSKSFSLIFSKASLKPHTSFFSNFIFSKSQSEVIPS